MALERLSIDDTLAEYLDGLEAIPEHIAARYEDLDDHPNAQMMTHPDVGRLLALLVRLTGGAVIEIGTFVGISAAWMASALPDGGRVDTLEISGEHADLAERWFADIGLSGRISVPRGPAAAGMERLPERSYDLCYIDADKPGYAGYLDRAARLVRHGGAIVADNALFGGRVVDPSATGNAAALREFTTTALARRDLHTTVLTVGDGVTLSVVA